MTSITEIDLNWTLGKMRPSEEYGFNPTNLLPNSVDVGYSMSDIDWRAKTEKPTNEECLFYWTLHEAEYAEAQKQENWLLDAIDAYYLLAPDMSDAEKVVMLEGILSKLYVEIVGKGIV